MIYLVSVNIIGFLLCYMDKRRAIKHKIRISENTLLLISLIGGALGILIGMNLFHHKTKKLKFKIIPILGFIICIFIMQIIY